MHFSKLAEIPSVAAVAAVYVDAGCVGNVRCSIWEVKLKVPVAYAGKLPDSQIGVASSVAPENGYPQV